MQLSFKTSSCWIHVSAIPHSSVGVLKSCCDRLIGLLEVLKDNSIMQLGYLSSRPIPARYCAEYLHFKTNPLYQHTVVLTANYYTNVTVDIRWDLYFKQALQFPKPKTKGRQIWPSPQAAKGPATPLVGAGVVICFELGADLHMAQLMPLPLTVSCFSIIQIGFAFLVPAHPGSPGKRAVKRVCACVCTQLIDIFSIKSLNVSFCCLK